MNRCSFCEWIPILPWPVWPLAGQSLLGQNVVVGSMMVLLALCGSMPRGVYLGPHFRYKCASPRFSAELPSEEGLVLLLLSLAEIRMRIASILADIGLQRTRYGARSDAATIRVPDPGRDRGDDGGRGSATPARRGCQAQTGPAGRRGARL